MLIISILNKEELIIKIVKGFWSDAGQFESLYMTSSFIRSHIIQNNENEGDM